MPRQKDLKRLVRARMRKTGESYTAARAHLIKRSTPMSAPPAEARYAKSAGMSDDAVRTKTGLTWAQWVRALDRLGAAERSHGEIAALIHERWKTSRWWSQMVAVGYERIKGLRDRGQRRGGQFEVSKSRTFDVPVVTLFRAVTTPAVRARWLPDAARLRTASVNRSARIGLADGAIATFRFTRKDAARTTLAVEQGKLPDRAAQERARVYWATRLAALAKLVEHG